MDVVKAVENYVEKIVGSISGLKVLLVDEDTTKVLSVVFSQSYLLENEVYLTDRLDHLGREPLKCMSCLVFCRPTATNIELLVEELRAPKYSEYRLCMQPDVESLLKDFLDFSNFLKNAHVERLAEADQFELVKDIKEYYADYQALYSNHFTFDMGRVVGEQINAWDRKCLQRCTEQLLALLLSLKRRPIVRYEASSLMAAKLAGEVKDAIRKELPSGLFDFQPGEHGPPVLIILDRRTDLATPLLLQWTYQAMIHDIYEISNGSTDISSSLYHPERKGAPKPQNLVPSQDSFFAANMDKPLHQVSDVVSTLVRELQERKASGPSLDSIPGLKRFVENYAQTMKMSGMVAKHVELVAELQKASMDLRDVSEMEQIIVTEGIARVSLREMLARDDIPKIHKLRLAVLYALTAVSQSSSSFNLLALFDLVRAAGSFSDEDIQLIDFFIKFTRTDSPASWSPYQFTATRTDQNVYTQHVPPLIGLLDALSKGRLRHEAFPSLQVDPRDPASPQQSARDIIVFIIEGTTYEEACHLQRYSQIQPAVRAVLGGTQVLNSTGLINGIRSIQRHLSS